MSKEIALALLLMKSIYHDWLINIIQLVLANYSKYAVYSTNQERAKLKLKIMTYYAHFPALGYVFRGQED